MNEYQPRTPRTMLALAAVALTAATLVLVVFAPASMAFGTREIGVLTQAPDVRSVASAASDATTASIDVVAIRATRLVPVVHGRAREATPALQG